MLIFFQKIKSFFRSWLRQHLIKIESLDKLYKNVHKLYLIPSETVFTPELKQISYDSEIVIAAHGAGLTNLIFSSNIKVLELFPTSKILTFYYYLSKVLGNKHNWLCHAEKISMPVFTSIFKKCQNG